MGLRQYRPGDGVRVEDLWRRNPSAEAPLIGLDPSQVGNILRRTERWSIRLVLSIASAIHRPLFKLLIFEEDGNVVGTTTMSFAPQVATVGGVVVDAAVRRRGHAQEMLRACERLARRYGRRYLVLDVLAENGPAVRLYEKLGYRPIRTVRWMSRELSEPIGVSAPSPSYRIRSLPPRMAKRLAHLANREIPASYRDLVSLRPGDLRPSRLGQRIGGGAAHGWILERGDAPVGFVRATVSPALQAAQIGPLALAGPLDAESSADLINTALGWCLSGKAPRAILSLPEHLDGCLPVLQAVGFAESGVVRTMALDISAR